MPSRPQFRDGTPARRLLLWWRGIQLTLFLLLCLRFQVAAVAGGGPAAGSTLLLEIGSLAVGAVAPASGLIAFAFAVPLLNGLGQMGLLRCPSPPSLVFSALFIGLAARNALAFNRESLGTPGTTRPSSGIRLPLDILIAFVLASAARSAWQSGAGLPWNVWWRQPVFGFADPNYSVTSAFVWLQGLFFFCALHDLEYFRRGWLKAVFVAYSLTIIGFVLVQAALHQPEPYDAGNGFRAFFSPYEDIHSFGAIVVSIFGYAIASWPQKRCRSDFRALSLILIRGAWIGLLFVMVVVSWSRATWLAAGVVVLTFCALRLRRRHLALAAIVLIGLLLVLNAPFTRDMAHRNPYLERLASLARLENPANKIPARTFLYEKAYEMIRQHPWYGHGIGSFYLTSVRFARSEDPEGKIPNFAHNSFLQMAAELGLPFAVLFAAVIGYVLWRGLRSVPNSGPPLRPDMVTAPRGASVALIGYLVTQMTANALNIYVSNQFYFWFLVGATLIDSMEKLGPAGPLRRSQRGGADLASSPPS